MHDCVFTLDLPEEDEDGPERGFKWVMQFEWARASVGGGCWQVLKRVGRSKKIVSVLLLPACPLTLLHRPPRILTTTYYTSILLHHPDPITPTTPPLLLLCCQPDTHELQTPAPTHFCAHFVPNHHNHQTCAQRIPDLSALCRRASKLPATALKGPSALRCHPIVRRAASLCALQQWIDPRTPSLYPAVVSTPAPSSSKQPPAIARLQLSPLLLPTASVALAAAPGVRALHYSPRQTEPDTSCAAAPLPPNRRLYSSR